MRSFVTSLLSILVAVPALAGVRAPGDCTGGNVGVPEPPRTGLEITGQGQTCHWLFGPRANTDVLVVDVLLPDLPGPDLTAELQESRPTPVLFCSGHNADQIEGVSGTSVGFLQKPFRAGQLLEAVRRLAHASQ